MITSCQPGPKPYAWDLPHSIPPPILDSDFIMTEASVELGRHLFYETALSMNHTLACASCHQQGLGFAENRAVSVGATGQVLQRNALALVNLAYNQTFTWAHDGLVTAEQQIVLPLFNDNPIEMGAHKKRDEIIQRLKTDKYAELFDAAYGSESPTWEKIVSSLASFVRSLTSFNSKFDAYAYGYDDNALNESELRGLNLFFSERLECFHCHGGLNFNQSSQHASQTSLVKPFHNNGLSLNEEDMGLYTVTRQPRDKGRFRAPTLRNIGVTSPYMHDGRFQTLDQVIDFYAKGGDKTHNTSVFIKGFRLSDQEKEDVIAFLETLTDEVFLSNPDHTAPHLTAKGILD